MSADGTVPAASRTPDGRVLSGHRRTRLGRSPFWAAAPSISAALVAAVAAVVWVVAGRWLPGGRWFAVHLLTLGVLTNLVPVFSEHFARRMTRADAPRWRAQPLVLNAGLIAVLVGIPTGAVWAVGAGATVATAVVFVSYRRLRRLRRAADEAARFAWVVRIYERAHGAFVHGAMLGLLMGVGLLPGRWYGPARLAHLHVNVLGWGGLTLLATLVFFGPSMTRTRIARGADDRAARALGVGATGLGVGVLALLVTGVGGGVATVFRVGASAGLAAYAWAASVVCLPVARGAVGAGGSATRWPVAAVAVWFPLLAWADVAVVLTGRWALLNALGLAMLLGVLVQAVAATLVFLTPMLRGRSFASRDLLLARLERGAPARTAVFHVGVLLVAAAATNRLVGLDVAAVLARTGWVLLLGALVQQLVAALWPLGGEEDPSTVRSQVAARYRTAP